MNRLLALIDALDLPVRADAARFTGSDPVLACRYPVGESAAAVLAAIGLLGRPGEPIAVDVRHAGALLRGFLDQIVDGETLDPDPTGKLPGVGLFEAADGRLVQTYGAFEPLLGRTLEVLGCDADGVAGAVARREAEPLAEALNAAGAPGAVARSAGEWAAHPHGRELARLPVVTVERIGDAPPRPFSMSGLRVLDCTRIVAGPVCGRTLAELGADVTLLEREDLHVIHRADADTSPGKRRAPFSDLDALLPGADVFLQSATPGSFERRGLGPKALARRVPEGLVYLSTDCYGHVGPWAARRGFEPLAQASTGWVADHGDVVAGLPCDYTTGFLSALGVLTALRRRATEGGAWHVRTSLSRTAMWLRDQPGRYDPAAAPDLDARATRDLRHTVDRSEPLRSPF